MLKLFFILTCIAITNTSTGQSIQREGLINMFSSTDPEGFRRYTWFEDSTVIYEIYSYFTESINDTVVKEGSRLSYYTILDVPTMRAQDYYLFSADSEPLTNYYLKDNEFVSWGSFSKNSKPDKFVDSLKMLADTIIDGNTLKRLYITVHGEGLQYTVTCGLSCSNPKTIFHFNRTIDEKYPGCQVTYYKYEQLPGGFDMYSKMKVIRDELTNSEKMIFKKWKSNFETTSLPVISQKAARQYISKLRSAFRKQP